MQDSAAYITISDEQFKTAEMLLGGIQTYEYADPVTANGYLDVPPENRVRIGTFMGGHVKSAKLIPGDHVVKGQVLFVLENVEYLKLQQAFLEAKEQFAYMKSVYESQKSLAEEKISAQKTYLQASSDYNRMLATCESLEGQLRLLQIDPSNVKAESMVSSINLTSPIAGYVTKVNAVNGMFVNPSDILCEIIDPSHLHIELKVFEKDILKLRKGQVITFRIPEASRETFTGEIILIGKAIEDEERTVTVHGHITRNSSMNFASGMYVEAIIKTDISKLYGLPAEALISEDGKNYVFVLNRRQGDHFVFEKVPVKIGKTTETWFEIPDTTGIFVNGQHSILIKGAYFLTEK